MSSQQTMSIQMRQYCVFPTALQELVSSLEYKEGWVFELKDMNRGQGSVGLTLCITSRVRDSNHPEQGFNVMHFMVVPAAAYNRLGWRRWLFDQILLVETHEACEFFRINGEKPYAPHHEAGYNPYTVFETGVPLGEGRRSEI